MTGSPVTGWKRVPEIFKLFGEYWAKAERGATIATTTAIDIIDENKLLGLVTYVPLIYVSEFLRFCMTDESQIETLRMGLGAKKKSPTLVELKGSRALLTCPEPG